MNAVRVNMLKDINYRPYCGGDKRCHMPRVDKNFKCPYCGWTAKFDPDFAKQYFKKHGKVIPT